MFPTQPINWNIIQTPLKTDLSMHNSLVDPLDDTLEIILLHCWLIEFVAACNLTPHPDSYCTNGK